MILRILFWIPVTSNNCKHETWRSMRLGYFWILRGANCLLFHPFLTIPLAEIVGIVLARGRCAKKATEKTIVPRAQKKKTNALQVPPPR
jgi:hypothetical protein